MSDPIITDFNKTAQIRTNKTEEAFGSQHQGNYRGEELKVVSETSLIEDAAEELTESIGEHQEKELSKREIKEGRRSDQIERIMKLKQIQTLMATLGDLRKEGLRQALAQLLRLKNASPRELQQRAREQLKEPAHQFALLSALLELLKDQGAPKYRIDAVQGALDELMERDGPEINAGINVSPVATEYANRELGEVQELRTTYRDAVLNYKGISEAYDELLEKYGPRDLTHAIRFLMEGLGADMSAQGPSLEKSRLNAILNDMYRLEVLVGTLEACNALMDKFQREGAIGSAQGTDLLKEVLRMYQDKWLNPDTIRPLAQKMGVQGISGEINFLRELKDLARDIPEKAYPEPEQRPRFLDAIQRALDDSIETEENEEE